MSRLFNVRLEEDGQAYIALMLPTGADADGNTIWEKRQVVAKTPDELWQGLSALGMIWDRPERHKHLLELTIPTDEHTRLEELTSAWEAQGNHIKKLPMMTGKKLRLSLHEEEEILALLESIDEEEEEELPKAVGEAVA